MVDERQPAARSVFISYASENKDLLQDFITKAKLTIKNYDYGLTFLWDEDLRGGRTGWEEKLESMIRGADIFLLMVSEASLASDYIWKDEVPTALRHEIPITFVSFDFTACWHGNKTRPPMPPRLEAISQLQGVDFDGRTVELGETRTCDASRVSELVEFLMEFEVDAPPGKAWHDLLRVCEIDESVSPEATRAISGPPQPSHGEAGPPAETIRIVGVTAAIAAGPELRLLAASDDELVLVDVHNRQISKVHLGFEIEWVETSDRGEVALAGGSGEAAVVSIRRDGLWAVGTVALPAAGRALAVWQLGDTIGAEVVSDGAATSLRWSHWDHRVAERPRAVTRARPVTAAAAAGAGVLVYGDGTYDSFGRFGVPMVPEHDRLLSVDVASGDHGQTVAALWSDGAGRSTCSVLGPGQRDLINIEVDPRAQDVLVVRRCTWTEPPILVRTGDRLDVWHPADLVPV